MRLLGGCGCFGRQQQKRAWRHPAVPLAGRRAVLSKSGESIRG